MKNIEFFKSLDVMFERTASLVLDRAWEAVTQRGFCSIVLSGGSTPLHLYRMMGQEPLLGEFPWKRTHIFWGDERQVSENNPLSNCGSALTLLPSSLPKDKVHKIDMLLPSIKSSANRYEEEILNFFSSNPTSEALFDLILLGMGTDGHTASLFPGSKALDEKEKLVVSVPAPEVVPPPIPRVTLTYPGLYRSRNILFLISGKEKVRLLKDFDERYPAARVKSHGEIKWFVHE